MGVWVYGHLIVVWRRPSAYVRIKPNEVASKDGAVAMDLSACPPTAIMSKDDKAPVFAAIHPCTHAPIHIHPYTHTRPRYSQP